MQIVAFSALLASDKPENRRKSLVVLIPKSVNPGLTP